MRANGVTQRIRDFYKRTQIKTKVGKTWIININNDDHLRSITAAATAALFSSIFILKLSDAACSWAAWCCCWAAWATATALLVIASYSSDESFGSWRVGSSGKLIVNCVCVFEEGGNCDENTLTTFSPTTTTTAAHAGFELFHQNTNYQKVEFLKRKYSNLMHVLNVI